ncbi:MAG TPA: WYL domain-containing protein [Candidatus Limnocylindrales bacterium]|jgi:predicted DNA-binding transcriptional regulator YafY
MPTLDTMRASRLVTLLLLLQTRGHMTASALAGELEVSVRTVLRDVDALAEAGVPVYSERGPHGGIRLVEGYRTRLTGMTGEEAEALFLSGLPGPAAELGLGTVVAAARLKVLAALPPELRARAARLVERFHLDASGWYQADEPVPHLPALSQGVWEGRLVEIEYERGDRAVTRALAPLGLVLKAGVWYVVAKVDDQLRTYRASRITNATLLDDRVERPDGFDLAAFWTESSSAYERDTPRIEVTVRVRPDRLDRLADAIGMRVVDAATRLDEPDPEGWTHLRFRLDWPEEAASRLLRAGPEVEVLDPPEVRARIAELAQRIAARYEGASASAATA